MPETERQSLLQSAVDSQERERQNEDNDASQPTTVEVTRRQTRRFLGSKFGHYSVLLLVSLDVSCIFADFIIQIFACEGKIEKRKGETTLHALAIVSLVFSSLFMVELLASIWAFGPSYFRSKFHCFDAIVIVTGFITDAALQGSLEEVASLIVVLRLWRVFKIIEELGVGAQEQMESLESRLEAAEHEKAQLQMEVAKFKAQRSPDVE